MILWLSVIAAGAVTAVAGWWIARFGHDPHGARDPDWGDWPSDQMGP